MGNAALENGACRELLVDVDGVVVAGHGGEQDDVGFRDGLGERGAHPDPQICKFVTSELIHRTALLDCTETRNSLLAAVKICTQMPPDLMSDRDSSPMLFFQNIASRCVLDRRVGSTADSRRRHSLSGTGLKPFGPIAPPAALVLFRASQPSRRRPGRRRIAALVGAVAAFSCGRRV